MILILTLLEFMRPTYDLLKLCFVMIVTSFMPTSMDVEQYLDKMAVIIPNPVDTTAISAYDPIIMIMTVAIRRSTFYQLP